MKVLISSCLLGSEVRWNKQSKLDQDLLEWVKENDIDLISVCPENELLGTPRDRIRLIQIEERIVAQHRGSDISDQLREKCKDIAKRHPDVSGFIGVYGSPTCGISVGVKNLGKTIKGFMHQESNVPTTESAALKNDKNKSVFLKRMSK